MTRLASCVCLRVSESSDLYKKGSVVAVDGCPAAETSHRLPPRQQGRGWRLLLSQRQWPPSQWPVVVVVVAVVSFSPHVGMVASLVARMLIVVQVVT